MKTKWALATALGSLVAISTAQAQFRIGADVSSNFGSAPLRGTPTYVYGPYYDGWSYYNAPAYYPPSYYGSTPSYYSTPSFYSSGVVYDYSTPGVSIGVGQPYFGGYYSRPYYGRSYWGRRYWR